MQTKYFICFIVILLGSVIFGGWCAHSNETGTDVWVGDFSSSKLDAWKSKAFYNETDYSLIHIGGESVLKAVSENAASGLIKKIRVDLEKTPFLNWRWRVEKPLDNVFDEKQKNGDDYAARIYVVVSGGIALWNTKALNYVWAKHSPKGDIWPNAFAKNNAMMVCLRSSKDSLLEWHREKRNIAVDFEKVFGKKIKYIDAVVLMSDTDNTKNRAVAYYGDIFFSAQ